MKIKQAFFLLSYLFLNLNATQATERERTPKICIFGCKERLCATIPGRADQCISECANVIPGLLSIIQQNCAKYASISSTITPPPPPEVQKAGIKSSPSTKSQQEQAILEKSNQIDDRGTKAPLGLPIITGDLNHPNQELRKREEIKKLPQIGGPLKTAEIKQAMQGLKKFPAIITPDDESDLIVMPELKRQQLLEKSETFPRKADPLTTGEIRQALQGLKRAPQAAPAKEPQEIALPLLRKVQPVDRPMALGVKADPLATGEIRQVLQGLKKAPQAAPAKEPQEMALPLLRKVPPVDRPMALGVKADPSRTNEISQALQGLRKVDRSETKETAAKSVQREIPNVKNPNHHDALIQLHILEGKIEGKLATSLSADPTARSYFELLKFYTAIIRKFIQIYDVYSDPKYSTAFSDYSDPLNIVTEAGQNLNLVIDELNALWEESSAHPMIDTALYKVAKDYAKGNSLSGIIWALDSITPYLIKAGIENDDLINPFDKHLYEIPHFFLRFGWASSENYGLGKSLAWDIDQGFKIHVSAKSAFADRVFKAVSPILKDYAWKFTGSSIYLDYINTYFLDQRGKFITIYPASDEESLEIAKKLDVVLSQLPREYFVSIPSDRPLGNSGGLFTRYGSYRWQYITIPHSDELIHVMDDRLGPWKHPLIPDIFEHDFPSQK